jgi:uncharacterized protein YfaS (alpha-2-macroglobulin family)
MRHALRGRGAPLSLLSALIALMAFGPGGGCGGKKGSKKTDAGGKVSPGKRRTKTVKGTQGLIFSLSEGAGQKGAAGGAKNVKGTPLSAAQVKALTARLPKLEGLASDKKAFAFRARSLPAPRKGKTISGTFPPPLKPDVPAAKASGPLKVLRAAPADKVGLAPNLSVTFNQPMVAVTSHKDSIAKGVPVKITPAIKGKWRWVGTKTLLFEPKPRFPMATRVTAEVPAGTKSAIGGKLAEAKKWSFSTPPPQLRGHFPSGGSHRRDVKVFVSFDQKIDPAQVFQTITMSGGKGKVSLKLLGAAALKQDPALAALVKNVIAQRKSDDVRWLAFQPEQLLEANTRYTVKVGPGTPSAEGPLKTKKVQSFTFRTYAPLKISYQSCKRYKCKPLAPLRINFNNRLDAEAFDAKKVKVSPKLPGMRVRVSYSSITVYGQTRGRMTYRVSVPSSVTDVYGQKLGGVHILPFRFGSANPMLSAPGGTFRVLDPKGDKSFKVHSINHKQLDVEIYRVKPEHWAAYTKWRQSGMRKQVPERPPGELKVKKVLRPGGEPDSLVMSKIDLKRALGSGDGQVIVLVKQRPLPAKRYRRQFVTAWLQSTELALDAFVDHTQMIAWVTRLADGTPVKGAKITLWPDVANGVSDATGLSRLELASKSAQLLIARAGGRTAMLPKSAWSSYYGWRRGSPRGEQVRWYVFDDRKLYKPKETVSVKGWARLVHMGQQAGIRLLPEGATKVTFEVKGPRGNKVAAGEAPLGKLGGFHFSFKLPDNVNLGRARVLIRLPGVSASRTTHYHRFRIQEFRRPEFEVSASPTSGPHFVGSFGQFTAKASYFSGGPLPNAEVSWRVTATAGSFTPPNQGKYTFVGWRPSWLRRSYRRYGRRARYGRRRYGGGHRGGFKTNTQTYAGRTDARGKHRLRIDFKSVLPAKPVVVRGAATIKDVNRQTWTTNTRLLVHPAKYYVGLRTKRYFVERGKPLEVQAIVSDIDGKLVAGTPIDLSAVRISWGWEKGRYVRKEVDAQTCNKVSAAKDVVCSFATKKGGTYLLRATIKDKEGRVNHTEMTRWVSGGKRPAEKNIKKEVVRLIADKKRYAPGETAEVLVQAPFEGAEGLLTVLRDGIIEKRRFSIKGSSHTLKVKIDERAMPQLSLRVHLVGKAPRVDRDNKPDPKLPARPAYAAGSLSLPVPPLSRRLKVEVTPAHKKASPGQKTSIAVTVKNADGKALANAGVALIVVDESVLALTGYKLSDPIWRFYPSRYGRMSTYHLRAYVRLSDPLKLLERLGRGVGGAKQSKMESSKAADTPSATAAPAPGAPRRMSKRKRSKGRGKKTGEKSPNKPQPKIAVRKNFAALALFAPALTTDAQGRVNVPFKLPDNLTRYRVMAVAVGDAKYYGKGESTVRARLPLMVRPSPPRFLNFGDIAELPVVLHNQTDTEQKVQVALRATNVELIGGAGQQVTIAADGRVEVRFPVKAVSPGTARFQLGISAGSFADAAQFKLPVWTPATTEAFATYGTVDGGKKDPGAVVQPVKMPSGVVEQFGGIEITTSSTALSALTDAVLYLVSYRFECSEQLSSRVMAVAALKDVLAAFKAPGLPKPAVVVAAVDRDLKRLQGMQNGNGGFPVWVRGKPSWPFMSVHVTHALTRAKAKGFKVPPHMLASALRYLKNIESHYPSYYSKWTRRIITSYALYVRALAGDADVAKAKSLLPHFLKAKNPYFEGIGWLYPVLSGQDAAKGEIAQIRKLLKNRVTETAAAAHFVTSYSDGAHLILHSDRRVDGLLLEGLIKDQPKSDLIVKIVRGLLAHRKRGRWGNTQENAWVLLALDRYFNAYEKITPNFVARAWLGPQFAGQHAFRGRSTDRHEIKIPMSYLAKAKAANLTLAKQGAGRLYYRIGMRYAPADLKPPPADHGFTVRRRYESVDDPKDVRRDKDGTWRVKAGARVRVVVTMVAPTRRYHVALVDPLPAGLEALNPALRGTMRHMPKTGGASRYGRGRHRGWGRFASYRRPAWRGGWYSRWYRWYQHHNLRDERAEAFSTLVWGGVHTFKYIARATTPGTFVVPPPKAEEMYHPETFGRGPGDKLIVE